MSIEELDETNVSATDTAASEGSTTETPSLDDSIARALDAHPSFSNKDEGEDEDEDEDDGDAVELEAEAEGGERQRGPDGKFLPKPKTNGTAAPQQAAAEGTQAAVPPVEQTPAVAKPHDAAPNTWKKELGADYAKLPEGVRQEIHRRENDFHKGISQYKEAAGFGQQLAQEMLPYQQEMQQHNIHPRDVVKSLLPAWKTLATGSPQDKANLVLQLVKDYGIDFTSLGTDPQPGTAQTTQADPRVAALERELGEIKGSLTAQERQRAQAEYEANVEQVNKFGSDPAHKHFPAVREHMAALIRAGEATDLKDAYNKAIWINPEVRASLLAEQEQERANKAASEAAVARKAAGANVTRRGTPPVKQTPGKIEDTIGAQLTKAGW